MSGCKIYVHKSFPMPWVWFSAIIAGDAYHLQFQESQSLNQRGIGSTLCPRNSGGAKLARKAGSHSGFTDLGLRLVSGNWGSPTSERVCYDLVSLDTLTTHVINFNGLLDLLQLMSNDAVLFVKKGNERSIYIN